MPHSSKNKKPLFDFRLRWLTAGLVLAGAVWLILHIGVPEAGNTIVAYCTPDIGSPLANCIEEFSLREGHKVIIVTQPADILAAHLIRTRDGDLIFATDENLFKELKDEKIITEKTETVLTCPGVHDGRAESCTPIKVNTAILLGSRHPDTAKCLITFLRRPECISMFRFSAEKKTGRQP